MQWIYVQCDIIRIKAADNQNHLETQFYNSLTKGGKGKSKEVIKYTETKKERSESNYQQEPKLK